MNILKSLCGGRHQSPLHEEWETLVGVHDSHGDLLSAYGTFLPQGRQMHLTELKDNFL